MLCVIKALPTEQIDINRLDMSNLGLDEGEKVVAWGSFMISALQSVGMVAELLQVGGADGGGGQGCKALPSFRVEDL